ncbi:DUF7573 domain-containing protein [Halopelagius longus]|uniref:DUF7573 domain-containing protein n=1 Tax=Halopelagius longus TaxID=1236180 RepID=A0A1H0XXV5_9EURY|nr:hypothetical protein [Halopelagius longus]RDI72159.1 hypothetical protein DWB78_10785 [Halopelagius longus]SDQ07665.1 hypothetical protein SAMN05216278_0265 [Halopelagius longus]
MTEDRSLDDFVGGSSDASASETGDDPDEASEPGEPSNSGDADADAPEPAVATYRWDPDGVECAACGESVERVWTSGDGTFVCGSCKEW